METVLLASAVAFLIGFFVGRNSNKWLG